MAGRQSLFATCLIGSLKNMGVLLLWGALSTARGEVLFEKASPRVVDRAVVVAASEFTDRRLETMASEFFLEQRENRVLARLTIGTTRDSVLASITQTRLETTYADESATIRANGLPRGPVARILVWDGIGVVSIRNGDYLRSYMLGNGKAKLVLHEGKSSYEMLHFQLSANAAPVVALDRFFLTLFLRAEPRLSASNCIALVRRLRKMTEVGTLSVAVRRDIWFFRDTGYPYVLPFARDMALPSEIHLDLAPELECTDGWRRGVTCSGKGFVP
jgi:hypothetical protein